MTPQQCCKLGILDQSIVNNRLTIRFHIVFLHLIISELCTLMSRADNLLLHNLHVLDIYLWLHYYIGTLAYITSLNVLKSYICNQKHCIIRTCKHNTYHAMIFVQSDLLCPFKRAVSARVPELRKPLAPSKADQFLDF